MAFCKFSPSDRMIDARNTRCFNQSIFFYDGTHRHTAMQAPSNINLSSVFSLSSVLLWQLSNLLNLVVVPVISIISLLIISLVLA